MANHATRPAAGRGLNATLWVLQILLGIFFLAAGYAHGLLPHDKAVHAAPWIRDLDPRLVLFIACAELAGALGVILPAATRIAPWLTPLAALGLAVLMALAVPFHILRGETRIIPLPLTAFFVALVVAWGRGLRAPIARRG